MIIYTKSCGDELMACLITKRAIPKVIVPDKEKFEIGLIGKLPVVKVPPGRKTWAAADVFDIFVSKFLYKVRPVSVLTQIDLARGHCDIRVTTRISMTGRKIHLIPPERNSHVQSNGHLIDSTFHRTISEELSSWTLSKLMALHEQGTPTGNGGYTEMLLRTSF